MAHVWVGDFNSLTRNDYTDDEWTEVVLGRERSNNTITAMRKKLEEPKSDVTSFIAGLGFSDCWPAGCQPTAPEFEAVVGKINHSFLSRSSFKVKKIQQFPLEPFKTFHLMFSSTYMGNIVLKVHSFEKCIFLFQL